MSSRTATFLRSIHLHPTAARAILALPWVLFAAFPPATAAQEYIVNGDFESPAGGNGGDESNPDGWLDLGAGGRFTHNDGGLVGEPVAHSGNQYIYPLGFGPAPGDGMYQTVNLPAAGDYSLVWFDIQAGTVGLGYTVNVREIVSAITVATGDFFTSGAAAWAPRDLGVAIPGAGSYQVEFMHGGLLGNSGLVAVDSVSFSPIPEPSVYGLATASLLALVAWRTRRAGGSHREAVRLGNRVA
jgi:hypothetical protein